MKKNIFLFAFQSLLSQQNIVIHNTGSPTEPSIAINKNNVNQLAAGSNINNFYYSNDGGLTWTLKKLTSSLGVWGDPSLIFDNSGNLFFTHLSNPNNDFSSWIDRIVVQKSTNGGLSFNDGSYTGLSNPAQQDKQWIAVDSNNNLYLTWTRFDSYGSSDESLRTNIMFSKSTDGGTTWSTAKRINQVDGNCVDSDDTVEGAVPAIGLNNEVYVSWAGPAGLVFDKSTDGGTTWLNNDVLVSDFPGGWDFSIPGLDRSNGFPITACDISNGSHRGTIYINWADQRNGTNNTDIWLAKSTDGGLTWSAPIKVNNDASGKHQFLTWMTIDQSNGNLYFVFYDRRNYSDNKTDVYVAQSTDGGSTFTNKKVSQNPFTPNDQIFFGDYTNIVAHNGVVRPIWGDQVSNNPRILTAIINDTFFLSTDETSSTDENISLYPNPVHHEAFLSYKLRKTSLVEINVYDLSGKLVHKITKKNQGYGKFIEKIDVEKSKLKQGEYICELKIDGTFKKSIHFLK